MNEVRVIAHFVTVVELAFLFLDDRFRNRERQWVWLALLVERLTVLVLLALDVSLAPDSWTVNRWLLTPVTVVMASALGWYVWQLERPRWEKRYGNQNRHPLDKTAGSTGAGH